MMVCDPEVRNCKPKETIAKFMQQFYFKLQTL